VTIRRVWLELFDLLTSYTFNSGVRAITALSLIYTVYKSLGHFKSSQSSVVVSRQRIYNSLTVTAAHYEVFFAQPNSFLAISSQWFCQLPTPATQFSAATVKWGTQLTQATILVVSLTPRHGPHRKYSSSIVACIRLRGNAFTYLFHINGCTRHISYRNNSTIVPGGHYLATAVSLPPQFLLCATTSQYLFATYIYHLIRHNISRELKRTDMIGLCTLSDRNKFVNWLILEINWHE
jgi:uncharacterized membrane protein